MESPVPPAYLLLAATQPPPSCFRFQYLTQSPPPSRRLQRSLQLLPSSEQLRRPFPAAFYSPLYMLCHSPPPLRRPATRRLLSQYDNHSRRCPRMGLCGLPNLVLPVALLCPHRICLYILPYAERICSTVSYRKRPDVTQQIL